MGGEVQKLGTHLVDAAKQVLAIGLAAHRVGNHVNLVQVVVLDQHFDRAVGVCNRRRIVAHHNKAALAGPHKSQNRGGNTRGHVDDQVINLVFQGAEGLHDARRLHAGQSRQLLHAGSAGHQHHTVARSHGNFLQRFLATHEMAQVEGAGTAQRNLRIGQSQVCVKQHHTVALLAECDGQIDRHGGFTDAAFAAGNADHFGTN